MVKTIHKIKSANVMNAVHSYTQRKIFYCVVPQYMELVTNGKCSIVLLPT